MGLTRMLVVAASLGLQGLAAQTPPEGTPTVAELWAMVQAQQEEITRLRELVERGQTEVATVREQAVQAQAAAESAQAGVESTQQQVEATAFAVESMDETGAGAARGWWDRTSLGGYGELHWNYFEDGTDSVDFHRFVLFVNHEFNDWISLFTELEIEHSLAGEGKPGEVELEQAFIRMDWSQGFSTDAGLFLMPIGMLNEIHEPNTFYGVERNNIEARIIPTTWWEAGLKGNWRFENGLSLEAGMTSGLDIDASGEIRGGRQKVAKAINEKPAYVGRIKYTGMPGLELGLSAFYQSDMAQSSAAEISGLLSAGHIDYRTGGFRIRALYARWDLDGTASPEAESQSGYYLEPSYRWQFDEQLGDIGVYFRYSNYRYFSGNFKRNTIYEIGINYWPTDYVVFKADLQDISDSDQWKSKGDKVLNVGLGYQF